MGFIYVGGVGSGGSANRYITIWNNTVSSNRGGINFGSPSTPYVTSVGNLVYGNIFNGVYAINKTLSVANASTNTSWNNSVMGNYWINPSMTGFSDTCTDSGLDGYCDSPYEIMVNETDYLPLAFYHAPVEHGLLYNTLTDVGLGFGNFVSAIQDPVVDFLMTLAFIGAVLSIFMAIAYVVKQALFK